MDSIPRYEFHKIFQRVSCDVNLKGASTPEEIDRRLEKAARNFREMARETTYEIERMRLLKKAKSIEILKEKGFANATIREAVDNIYGLVGLTLRFDRRKADEMRQAFERARKRRPVP